MANPLKDLRNISKNVDMKQMQALFDTLTTMNDNMLFIQRNQCEIEAYLSLIAEALKIDNDELKKRIAEIQEQFD